MRGAWIAACAALIGATPLAAQDATAPAIDATATLPAPAPERLAVAERVVDRIWPVGTLRRMMESSMSGYAEALTGVEAAIDTGGGDSKAERRAQHEARTGRSLSDSPAGQAGGQSLAEMNAVLLPIFERIEPPMRVAIARIYARRYDVAQLGELEAFFSTPTGSAYAADSLTIMNDPEMVAAMQAATLEIMSAIPQMLGVAMSEGAAAEAAAAAAAAADAVASAATIKVE